jgi:peptidoglycan/LPS O-acetylase OafA/YrhL
LPSNENKIWHKILLLFSDGGTGVSIFFILSGFLITYLLISEYELNSEISLRRFYLRRILRIWPLYYVVIGFTFLLYPTLKSLVDMNHPLCSNYLYYISFLSNFDVIHILKNCPGKDALSQNITWSISVEEQFYLFWPILFAYLPKRLWIYAITFTFIFAIIFQVINRNDFALSYYHTFSALKYLSLGGLCSLLIKEYPRIRMFFERSSTGTQITLFSISFLLMYFREDFCQFEYGNLLNNSLLALSFALIISGQALSKSISFLNLGNFKFASNWGKYTYGIYLLHPIVITLMDVVIRILKIPKNNFINSLILNVFGLLITMIISKLSYVYFESMFLRIKEKFETIKTVP